MVPGVTLLYRCKELRQSDFLILDFYGGFDCLNYSNNNDSLRYDSRVCGVRRVHASLNGFDDCDDSCP
jgi:hypothetical protein